MSTVLISNISASDIKIEDYSTFAAVNLTTARLSNLDKSLLAGGAGVYAETRPFVVYNCSFESVQIVSNSYLLASTNPMVIVQSNKFANISVIQSVLLQLGNYIHFLSSDPHIHEDYLSDTAATILSYPDGENAIFQPYPELVTVYNNARTTISASDPKNSIFFIFMDQNEIINITNANNAYLIVIYNFEIVNGSIAITNNNFTNISSNRQINLIYSFSIKRGIFGNNTFSTMNLTGYAFLFICNSLKRLLLNSNLILQTQQFAMYSITATACNKIIISNATAVDIQLESTFIDVSCVAIGGNVTIQGSRFANVIQTNVPHPITYPLDLIASLKFIAVKESNLYSPEKNMSRLVFQNNNFSNCTVRDTQGYTQGLDQSSLVYLVSFYAEVLLNNNSFHHITTAPNGNTMMISAPTVNLSHCKFHSLSFGGVDGAIHVISEYLSVEGCNFTASHCSDSDGVGILKLTNPQPQSVVLNVTYIKKTSFEDNIAPYSTLLYVKESSVNLTIDDSDMLDNYRTTPGSMLTLWNTSNSTISITNSRFRQNQDLHTSYPELKIIGVESTGPHVFVQMTNLTIDITGGAKGIFIGVSGPEPVNLMGNLVTFSVGSDVSSPPFGLFEGDNFNATFTNTNMKNISLGARGLFKINANSADKENSSEWRLKIMDSSFEDMKLRDGLIVINADDSSTDSLNHLSVILENTNISQVEWLGASNGIVSSSTSRIGRNAEETDFAIIFNRCNFVNLTGNTGLILSSVEPMYDSLTLIMNCTFHSIQTIGPGTILNPSIGRLTSFITNSTTNGSSRRRNPTFRAIGNNFENISSSSGTLLYSISMARGTFLDSEDNRFENIHCEGNGGLVFARYLPLEDNLSHLTSPTNFQFTSRNDTITVITGTQRGGVIFAEGQTGLFNITIIEMVLSKIECYGDGGIVYLVAPAPSSLLALDVSYNTHQITQVGTISISRSKFSNINVQNGGIIYEETPNNTLNFLFDSNILDGVSANARGAAFYWVEPIASITNNSFFKVFAGLVNSPIFSVSTQIDLPDFEMLNTITPSPESVASFAPTNLLVDFISLHDGSSRHLDYEDTPPYNPIVPNLTSYSLSDYQIKLTLVSHRPEGHQIVYDESTNARLELVFFTSRILSSGENRTFISKNCYNSSCTAIASTITLRGLAGESILVIATYKSDRYTQFQRFHIKLRGCIPGERNNSAADECIKCVPGTYSLNPNDNRCFECPGGANCSDVLNVRILKGFYNSSTASNRLQVIDCKDNGTRCLGSIYNSNYCSENFTGPVCLQCNLDNEHFMSASSGKCVLCSRKNPPIAHAVLWLLGTIVYQIVMIIITYRDNKQTHAQNQALNEPNPGQFLVILATFTQISYVVANVDENTISILLRATNLVGNPYHQVFSSLQCLYLLNSNHDKLGNDELFKALKFQVLIYVFSPMIKTTVVIICEVLRNLFFCRRLGREKWKISLERIGVVAVVLILLEQPGIIGLLSKYLTCSKLDNSMTEEYIQTYNSIQCGTSHYNFFKYAVVIPALTFWALLIPLAIFIILRSVRKKLHDSESLRTIFGSLYNAYLPTSFYWGLLIIIFKSALYVLNSVITASPIIKGVIFMTMIHVYFFALKREPRYRYISLTRGEELCYYAYIATLSLIFIRFSTSSVGLKYACSVMIVIAVSIAGLYALLHAAWFGFKWLKKCLRRKQNNQINPDVPVSRDGLPENPPSYSDQDHPSEGNGYDEAR